MRMDIVIAAFWRRRNICLYCQCVFHKNMLHSNWRIQNKATFLKLGIFLASYCSTSNLPPDSPLINREYLEYTER